MLGKWSILFPLCSAYLVDQYLPFYIFSVVELTTKFKTGVHLYATFKRHPLKVEVEIKGWKRGAHENTSQKKAGVSIYTIINIEALS